MLNSPTILLFFLFSFIVTIFAAPASNEEKKEAENDKEEVRKLMAEINRKNAEKLTKISQAQEKDEKLKEQMGKIAKRRKETQSEVHNEKRKSIPEINANIPDADTYYQADMKLTVEQAKQILVESSLADEGAEGGNNGQKAEESDGGHNVAKRQALNLAYYTASQWSNGNVYYTFDSSISATLKTLIQESMQLWSSKTCLNFIESSAASNRLNFTTREDGCWAWLGRVSTKPTQEVNLGPNCDQIGIIAHEIGHALGFWHGQSRYDRDSWIYYNAAYVMSGQESQFNKETTTTNNNYNQVYDYGSIMHYADTAFSKDGVTPVMYTKLAWPSTEWQSTMGQRMGPSMADLKVMNALYNCASRCTTPITCYNGGYQSPKNCAICVCPPGIGGNDCGLVLPANIRPGYAPSGVPNTCPGTNNYAILNTWTELSGQIGTTDTSLQDESDYAWCHWFLYTENTNRIVIELLEVGDYCSRGCFFGNVEIRVWENADWGKTGRRFCCSDDLWAQGNGTVTIVTPPEPGYRAIVSLYASFYRQRFRLRYKAVQK